MKWIFPLRMPKYSFSKVTLSIPTRIPPNIIYVILFASIFYIYMGGVYNILNNPIPFGSDTNGNVLLIQPGISTQFFIEGLVAAFTLFMGAFGIYVVKDSAAYHDDQSNYTGRAFFGYIIIIVSFVVISLMFAAKS